MTATEIRQKFLDFFASKGHNIVPSAPMVVHNDPTLMFTNAGMNQFKDFFLGNEEAKATRVADTQKCLRVSGKHNDLEEVGIDTYHHTMFEMLGNWSFGDYFKKEAIQWAWELLTEVYGLPKDRLYATVFEGDKDDDLTKDEEAFSYWSDILPSERILDGNKKDNFWEMGDTGPCGPCSEIHIDLRSSEEIKKMPGKDLVNQDHPLVVEIWNLVFMQFNRKADGTLVNLPAQHVDTGMGFERLAMAIQGKKSNYDTDVFQPIIEKVSSLSGISYGDKKETDIAIRVVSDHIRAIAFAIADGQLPSNVKAGYVIRRILRRAVRYGYTFLGFEAPFLYKLVSVMEDQFTGVFPEIQKQSDFIARVVREEETSFLKTLERGLKRIDSWIEKQGDKQKIIDGTTAFELYDTYGFPLDLTALIAREKGFSVDTTGFEKEMEVQKSRSKNAAKKDTGDWEIVHEGQEVQFTGYENLTGMVNILRYRAVEEKKRKYFQVVFDQTPFYAESGGQVGDTGFITDGNEKHPVVDTQKENDLIVHFMPTLPKNIEQTFEAVVNRDKRLLIMNNHSATHLMHAALRNVLGDHVQQKGSLVNDKILRFDFSHFAKMTTEEIKAVEHIVNRKIRENIALDEKRNVPIEEAKDMGAMALFGEKYGDFVRMITFDKDFSVELCGGTHVPSTGHIGYFKIVSEGSVAAGVRRIEAITADEAEEYFDQQEMLLSEINHLLKNPKDTLKAIENLQEERNKLAKTVAALEVEKGKQIKEKLLQKIENNHGMQIIIDQVKLPSGDALKKLTFELKNELENLILVIAANIEDKPQIAIAISENLVKDHGLHAGNLVRDLAKKIRGGGGGQPFYATAGGKDVNGLGDVVTDARTIINSHFS